MTEITEAVERLKGDADYIAKCSPNISTLWDRGVGNRRYINSVGRDIDALLSELTRLQEEVKGLRGIERLARELISPAGMVNRGVDRGLVVIEKADKSDPHYRLCSALDELAGSRLAATLTPGEQS